MADLAEDKKIEEPEVAVCESEEKKIEEPIDDFEPTLTFSMIGQKEFTVHESPIIDTCVSNEEVPKEAEVANVEFIQRPNPCKSPAVSAESTSIEFKNL